MVPRQIEDRLKEIEAQQGTPQDEPAPVATPESVTPAPEPQEPQDQAPPADPPQHDDAPTADGDIASLPAWAQVHVAKLDADNRALRGKLKAEGPRHANDMRELRNLNIRLQNELATRDERAAQQERPPATPMAEDRDALAADIFTAEEREWFRLLQTVQNVGARVALNVLSALSPRDLERALALGDKAVIGRAQGVGPKLALRIVTELKDKAPSMMLRGHAGEAGGLGVAPLPR